MDETITTSIRIDKRRADHLAKIAEVQRTSVAEEIRTAIELHIESKRKDPEFQRALKVAIEHANRVFGELGGD